MGLLEGLTSTRAIRRYTDEPVPSEVLRAILFAATRAPTDSNRQAFRFLVLAEGPEADAAKRVIAEGDIVVLHVHSVVVPNSPGRMIVDIFMPHMRGFESIRIFHERAPTIPLIAMSGYAFAKLDSPAPDFLRMALELGAARCLRKPFTPGALSLSLTNVLPKPGPVSAASFSRTSDGMFCCRPAPAVRRRGAIGVSRKSPGFRSRRDRGRAW